MNKIRYIIFTLAITLGGILQAQDLHLSQYYSNSVYYNPASTGMIKDYFRVSAQSRSQWGNISGKYLTSLLSFDMPYNDRIGFGAYIVSDDAARALNIFKFVISAAYQITTPNDKHFLSGGLQVGFMSMQLNYNELTFDNQWVIDNFDSDVPSGELTENRTVYAPEVNLGIYYKFLNNNKMFQPYASFTIYHATMPKIDFIGDKDKRWPMRFQTIIGTDIIVNNQLTIIPGMLGMYQENIYELLPGFRGKYTFNSDIDLYLGGYYRINDAIVMLIGTKYKNFRLLLSYDYNISDLAYYTNGKGAFELSVIFVPKK
jgi:type IX secretion system PorP/SprF family membrane protein